MKKFEVIIIVLIIFVLGSCASVKGEVKNEEYDSMELFYETDFSRDDGAFNPLERGEINEIQKGVLHLKAAADGRVAWADLKKPYGNNSATTFRIKFGEQVSAHINFLHTKEDRLLLHFMKNNLVFHSFLDRREISTTGKKVRLTSGRWYDFTVSIIDYKASVYIDGVKKATVALDRRLPAKAHLSFECHGELWVDDLRIVQKPAAMKEEQVVMKEEQVAVAKGNILYETDFSRDDGAFNREQRGVVNEIKDGVLHLRGFGDKSVATAELTKLYGSNSVTTFKIRFGEKRIKEEALAGVNFLCLWKDNKLLIVDFFKDRLTLSTRIAGKTVDRTIIPASFSVGQWYDVQVTIKNYRLSISIDGKHMKTIDIHWRLPSQGYLNFAAHEEFWVDDLRIVREPVVMKEEPVAVSRGKILYETDFSRDDGMFAVHRQLWEVKNGVLHLKGKDPGGHLKMLYGRNSKTSFRVKLSPKKPTFRISVLWDHDRGMGHNAFIAQNYISHNTLVNGMEVFGREIPHSITPDKWHEIDIVIQDREYQLFVDGRLAAAATLHEGLPEKGYLFLLTHDTEIWVDDLKIVEGPVEIIEAPIEIAEKPVEIKEEPVAVVRELRGEGLELSNVEFENIFPVFFKYYDEYPIGKAVLRNFEDVPISDIEVKLFIKQYMDNPKICGAPTEMKAGEEKEIKLNALFTNKVLEITEGTKVSTNITIEYKLRGKAHTTEKLDTLRIQNRNAMTWEDDRRAAAFVTAKDPVVLKFSKNISGMIKEKGSKAINANLRMAMALHEALTLYGMSYVVDPTTPYKEFSKMRQEIDFLQFPKQSLDYKAGDCDDLSILNCALLESVGIETALITVPGHIFMAFSVDMKPDEGRKRFLRADELIFREDKTWIPVEITEIGGGFLKAWQRGAKQWRENVARGQAGFYPMHEAWGMYEPVGLPGEVIHLTLPDRDSIISAYLQELIKFIDREIYPQVAKVQAEIKKSKANSKDVNKLGILYARYGLTDRAEREFKKILEKNKSFIPALVNLGNICYLNNDMKNALKYYERAYKVAPKNPRVLLCIARTHHELENYGMVKETYSSLKQLNPDLAYQFSYLDLRGEEAVRAAEISKVQEVVIWEE